MADVAVRFGGDASGAVSAGGEAAGAVTNLGAVVKGLLDLLVELGGAATGSFRQMGTAAREAGEQVKGTAASVKEFREGVAGIGEALIAAFAIHEIDEFAKKMGEAAEATFHTALAFGLTTGQVQEMKGQFVALGLAPEAGITAMMRLDRAFAQAKQGGTEQAEVFKKLGIDIHGAYTQSQLWETAIRALATVPAGPARVADAMRLFGRNIQQIAPLLGMTKEQLAEVNAEMARYGVVSDQAEQKGLALAEAFNTNKLAGQGLMNVLTDALAPAFTQVVQGINSLIAGFIASYQQGGAVKILLELLVGALKLLETALVITGGAFAIAFDIGKAITATVLALLQALYELVRGPVLSAIQAIEAGWARISAPVMGVINGIIRAVTDAARAVFAFIGSIPGIGPAFQAAGRIASAALSNIVRDAQNAGKSLHDIWAPGAIKLPALPKAGTGTTLDDPNKAAKTKKQADDVVRAWEEQFREQQALSGDFFGDENAKELAFWQSKLGLVKDHSKQWFEIQEKIFQLEKTLARQAREEALDQARQGAEGKTAALQRGYEAERSMIQQQQEALKSQRSRGLISVGSEYAGLKASLAEETALTRQHEDQIFEIKKAELTRELALYSTDPVNAAKINAEIERLEETHQATLTAIAAKGEQQRAKLQDQQLQDTQRMWEQRLQPLQGFTANLFTAMATHSQSFAQVVSQGFSQLVSSAIQNMSRMLFQWIAQHLAMTAVHATATATQVAISTSAAATTTSVSAASALAQMGHSAAVAAGRVYASIAAIPIVGPFLAPAMAAAALAAVFALGASISSAAGGWDSVPQDGMKTELHKDEMVLSAKYARPLRSMLEGMDFGSTGAAGAGAHAAAQSAANSLVGGQGRGDAHFHFMPNATLGGSKEDLDSLLSKHGKQMLRWINNKVRNGELTPKGART